MDYKLICPRDDAAISTDIPANKGWQRVEIVELLGAHAARYGDTYEVIDSDDLSDDELLGYYRAALLATDQQTREVREVFEDEVGQTSDLGTLVPVLLRYPDEAATIPDQVYPHSTLLPDDFNPERNKICTIFDYLSGRVRVLG